MDVSREILLLFRNENLVSLLSLQVSIILHDETDYDPDNLQGSS